jgi:hypothetical protein
MKNRTLVLGMLVMVLAIGILGCDDGSKDDGKGGNDGSLNGTWNSVSDNMTLVISGSNFTFENYKGTISYNGSTMTLKSTHIWDGSFSSWVAFTNNQATIKYSLSGNTLTILGNYIFSGDWTKSQ